MDVVDAVIPNNPAFMNTQLFFNPVNPQQKDFWHRDCQYDYDVEDQMRVILETQVLHLRVPLFDEPGMEIIPGTHKRWDNEEEYNPEVEKIKVIENIMKVKKKGEKKYQEDVNMEYLFDYEALRKK